MNRLKLYAIAVMLLLVQAAYSPTEAAPPPPPVFPEAASAVERAIQQEILLQQEIVLPYLLFKTEVEDLQYSEDGNWVTAQLISVDPGSGIVVPTEPGLAIVRRTLNGLEVFLPNQAGWEYALLSLPDSLLSQQEKVTWQQMFQEAASQATTVYGGYKLPWAGGGKLVLTQSISHYNPPNPAGSMHYSFDFAAWHDSTGQSPMFAVHAAKGGRVKWVRWSQANGDSASPGNYLVIEDLTTSPPTYALYLHLAQDSIPVELRQVGATVLQGQYLGLADDTGYSTGNHLHFQVHTNPGSYWGNSVDITFSDVAINSGRPRTPSEASNWPQYGAQGQLEYTSGNSLPGDDIPPTGGLFSPSDKTIIGESEVQISGWAEDDISLAAVQVKAHYSGAWHPVGSISNASAVSFTWDLCGDDVPDGPVSLMLDIRDSNGNIAAGVPGLRRFIKQHECPQPPPACLPGANQVAIYSDPDFRGSCILLNTGTHSSSNFGDAGNDNIESILVGTSVWVTLFNGSQQGRGSTFWNSDSNLSDNRIGSNRASSLVVRARATGASTPLMLSPANQAEVPANASFSLSWDDTGGASEFQVKWDGVEKPWSDQIAYHLGSVSSGAHTWQVRARNPNGTSNWSSIRTINALGAASNPDAPEFIAPYSDMMENGYNGWVRGEWDQTFEYNHTPGGGISFNYEINDRSHDYNTGGPNSGFLTSPVITIPATGYALQFWYRYETEGSGAHWDQRWVQISVDHAPFSNVYQLFDDPPGAWLRSPPIDLSAYAGHDIQVRFHFETLDAAFNEYEGWFIDDVTIDTFPQAGCLATGEPDESPAQAMELSLNQTIGGQLCPQGDVDYFRFSGQSGDLVSVFSSASTPHQPDSYLTLLDSDFSSILSENDDIDVGVLTDAYLTYRLKRDGIYTIKLRAWDHPSAGGIEYNYNLSLFGNDDTPPAATLISPRANLPLGDVLIQVDAQDPPSPGEIATGISHVEFFWHSGDWSAADWVTLGSDWDSSDGWSYNFDTSLLPDERALSFFVRVYDWAGNWYGAASWDLCLGVTNCKVLLPFLTR